jgi:hypothetical protein
MTDTVTVASRAHMAIHIREPLPKEYKDRPGDAPLLRSAVINGSNHENARAGVGITQNVDAETFRLWHEQQVALNSALADLVSIVSADDAEKDDPTEYGFEPGLRRAAEGENASAAADGSTVTHGGPVSAGDMAATSDTPNDDSPRSSPDGNNEAHSQVPGTAIASGVADENH